MQTEMNARAAGSCSSPRIARTDERHDGRERNEATREGGEGQVLRAQPQAAAERVAAAQGHGVGADKRRERHERERPTRRRPTRSARTSADANRRGRRAHRAGLPRREQGRTRQLEDASQWRPESPRTPRPGSESFLSSPRTRSRVRRTPRPGRREPPSSPGPSTEAPAPRRSTRRPGTHTDQPSIGVRSRTPARRPARRRMLATASRRRSHAPRFPVTAARRSAAGRESRNHPARAAAAAIRAARGRLPWSRKCPRQGGSTGRRSDERRANAPSSNRRRPPTGRRRVASCRGDEQPLSRALRCRAP